MRSRRPNRMPDDCGPPINDGPLHVIFRYQEVGWLQIGGNLSIDVADIRDHFDARDVNLFAACLRQLLSGSSKCDRQKQNENRAHVGAFL